MLHQVGDLFELNVKLRCQKGKSIDEDLKTQPTKCWKYIRNIVPILFILM
jgi:hypothetical protein